MEMVFLNTLSIIGRWFRIQVVSTKNDTDSIALSTCPDSRLSASTAPSLELSFLHPFLHGHESWRGACHFLDTKGCIPVVSCNPSRLLAPSRTRSVTNSDFRVLTIFQISSSFLRFLQYPYLCSADRWPARLLWHKF